MGFNSGFKGLNTRRSCQILMKYEFSRNIFENAQMSNFLKICQLGAEFLYAKWRTDMTKLLIDFRNFEKSPKISPASEIINYGNTKSKLSLMSQ